MTWLSAIIMGLVQGIAEFLPISSSGHLAIAEHLLNMQGASEIPQFYDVLLHLGTLVAVFIAYWDEIYDMIVEFFAGVGDVLLDGVEGDAKVVGDLFNAPTAGGEHTDTELGGSEVIGNIVAGGRIVNAPPAPGKTIGDVDDAAKRLRRFRLYDRFQHTAEQTMVLAKRLKQIVELGNRPGCPQMRLCPLHVAPAHQRHHARKMEIDRNDRLPLSTVDQRRLRHTQRPTVITRKIKGVRPHIERETAQPLRQQRESLRALRQRLRRRKMQQHRRRAVHERLQRRQLWIAASVQLADRCQRCPCLWHLSRAQAGKPSDQCRRKTNLRFRVGSQLLRQRQRLHRLAAKIMPFCQRHQLLCFIGERLRRFPGTPRQKIGAQKRHLRVAGNSRPRPTKAQVVWLLCILGIIQLFPKRRAPLTRPSLQSRCTCRSDSCQSSAISWTDR